MLQISLRRALDHCHKRVHQAAHSLQIWTLSYCLPDAIDLFCLSILFPQYRSCDDTQESALFESWTLLCSNTLFLMNTTKLKPPMYCHVICIGKAKSASEKGILSQQSPSRNICYRSPQQLVCSHLRVLDNPLV